MFTVKKLIESFYDGLESKTEAWQQNLGEDVVFSDASRRLHAEGRQAFIQSFTPFIKSVEHVRLKQLIVAGPDACAVVSYDYVNSKGDRLHQDDAEVWKVVDGKISALTIFFDLTEFQSFMRR